MQRPWLWQRSRAILTACVLLPLLPLTLASCQNLVSKPILVHRDPPGPDLTDCPEEPLATSPFMSEAERYDWAARAIYTGRECREVLRKAKVWMLNPPQ